jgi:hypothetical protein
MLEAESPGMIESRKKAATKSRGWGAGERAPRRKKGRPSIDFPFLRCVFVLFRNSRPFQLVALAPTPDSKPFS